MPQKQIRLVDESDKSVLYDYARLHTEITDKFNIPLFAISGTLIGCVRYNDVIPWDDDIDYAIKQEDEHLLNDPNLFKYVNERGYLIFRETKKKYDHLYHILNMNKPQPVQDTFIEIDYPILREMMLGRHPIWKVKNDIISDIFIYNRKNENTYELSKNLRQYISADKFILTKYKYGNTFVYSISDPHDYLTVTYGNYMEPKFTHQHRQWAL